MREQGGGTLFSQVIETPKLSVKVAAMTAVAAAESTESKRRLSNGGSTYVQSYGGAAAPKSMLGGRILQASAHASMQPRLKGGSTGSTMLLQGQRHGTLEMHDFSGMERLKELKASLEPLLKTKPAHYPSPPPPPPHEESSAAMPSLPQWGVGKRPRSSTFKPNCAAVPAKALPLRSSAADEAMNPVCAHGGSHSATPVVEPDGQSGRAGDMMASRNGTHIRAAANGGPTVRHGNGKSYGERAGGSLAGPSLKGEPSTSARQRSEGSSEAAIVNTCSNGYMVGAAHIRRVSASAEAATGSASLNSKPRLELQTLDWPRFIMGLSRKDKEDDFLIFKGTKLPQRPRKRPKIVERAVHYCTPGNSLSDLSRGRYDVREKKFVKKRPRGLKAMESLESGSE
ncbi:hypothetical protein L7F22_026937 [Adiantum nelumboides]|nr:hypothetical protein [Adiantum nelumboides]